MRRREFIALLGSAAWSTQAWAQTLHPPGKIGYLHPVTASPDHVTLSILAQAWHKLGYVEGQNVILRSGDRDPARLPVLVAELIAEGAGVLIVVGAVAVRAAAKATTTTPIVAIDFETDPVQSGLIASYARPGGNVTGLFLELPALAGNMIQRLRDSVPGLQRIALLWDPSTDPRQLNTAKDAAHTFGLEVVVVEVLASTNFERLFATLGGAKRTGLVQFTTPGASTIAPAITAAAIKHRLPMISFVRAVADAGVLMSYGPSQEYYYPRAVAIAAKILGGEKPGEIPIERPARFEFVVNMKTAKALGLTLPPEVLLRADDVIE